MSQDPTTVAATVQTLNQEHGNNGIRFNVGKGGWPEAVLKLPNGAHSVICFFGGQVLTWCDAKGREILYLSPNAEFAKDKAIRGGVPVIFPWFGKVDGTPRAHGFARNMLWNFISSSTDPESPSMTLGLESTDATLAQWPHAFKMELTFSLGESLKIDLKLKNTSKQNFSAQLALHNYITTQSIHNVQIRGLENAEFIDKAKEGLLRGQQASQALKFIGLVDRVYKSVTAPVTIHGIGGYVIGIESTLPDRVAWNPGKVAGASINDLPPQHFEKFVCLEAGAVENRITLAPGQEYKASQEIKIQK